MTYRCHSERSETKRGNPAALSLRTKRDALRSSRRKPSRIPPQDDNPVSRRYSFPEEQTYSLGKTIDFKRTDKAATPRNVSLPNNQQEVRNTMETETLLLLAECHPIKISQRPRPDVEAADGRPSGRRPGRRSAWEQPFSLSRTQSRACAGYAEVRKRPQKAKVGSRRSVAGCATFADEPTRAGKASDR